MTFAIKDGQMTVGCHYGLKMGRPAYSSEDTSMSIDLTFPVEGDEASMLALAGQLEDVLMKALKVAVTAELGVTLDVDESGALRPQFQAPATSPPPQVAAAPAAIAPPVGVPQAPAVPAQAGGQYAAPKATKEQVAVLPRINVDFGKGMATYIDQRPLKEQGLYSPKAPDFKNAVDGNDGVWLNGPNGNPNTQVHAALAAAIAAMASPDTAPF